MKKDWLARCYEALWSWIGGRPWTYIMRDSQQKHPLLWMLIFGAIGMVLGHLFW